MFEEVMHGYTKPPFWQVDGMEKLMGFFAFLVS